MRDQSEAMEYARDTSWRDIVIAVLIEQGVAVLIGISVAIIGMTATFVFAVDLSSSLVGWGTVVILYLFTGLIPVIVGANYLCRSVDGEFRHCLAYAAVSTFVAYLWLFAIPSASEVNTLLDLTFPLLPAAAVVAIGWHAESTNT